MKKNVILVVALFALMAVGVSAQTGTAGLEYKLLADGKAYSVSQGTAKGAIVIPASYNNLPVTTIASDGFKSSNVNPITIPNSVTTIGNGTFKGCIALTSITLPASVTNIGNSAFADCVNLTSVTFQGAVASAWFDSNAFIGSDLRNKHLAAGGGTGTYSRSPGGSTWTKQGATTAAAPATAGNPGLAYKSIKNGAEYSVSAGTVKEGAVVIPASYDNKPVTTIAIQAFNMLDITSVTIPNSVTSILGNAFAYCRELTSVTIPNSVTSIESQAFVNCKKLTSVTISNSVKKIGESAFEGSDSLTSVTFQGTIPSGSFDAYAFEGLGDLRAKFYATDKTNGTAGTYTRPNGTSTTWTKK